MASITLTFFKGRGLITAVVSSLLLLQGGPAQAQKNALTEDQAFKLGTYAYIYAVIP